MKQKLTLGLLVTLSMVTQAQANVAETLGFGARASGLGGASLADGSEAYTSYANPAGLATLDSKSMYVSYGVVFVQPAFTAIKGVQTQNYYVADQNTVSDVDNTYEPTLGQLIGVKLHPFADHAFWNASGGIAAFVPIQHFAYMNTGEAFVPEYVLFRSRTQRPQIEAGFALSPFDGFSFGAGLHLGFSLNSKAVIFLQNNTQLPSSMRFESRITPLLSPYFGIQFNESGVSDVRERKWSAGAVVRLPQSSANNMELVSTAAALGSSTAITIRAQADSILFYDPLAVELGGSFKILPAVRLNGQIDYQNWEPAKFPAINISQVQGAHGEDPASRVTVPISPTANPVQRTHAIFVPRVGVEVDATSALQLRAGYFYRSSIFNTPSTGAGNLIDPSRHGITAGAGVKGEQLLGKDIPWHVDVALTFQPIVPQTVVKTAGDELGREVVSRGGSDIATGKIGSPGYGIGGCLWGGAVSVSIDL